jgi:hypothetical protein
MAAILFLIIYQNIQKWFKIYQICAFNNFLSHFDRILVGRVTKIHIDTKPLEIKSNV